MKITFVEPPHSYLFSETKNVSLGILYLASYIRKHGFTDVSVLDLRGKDPAQWDKMVGPSDVFCIGPTTPDYNVSVKISKFIKAKYPNSIFIIGGPHVSIMKDADEVFDYIVLGPGELILKEMLANLPNLKERVHIGRPMEDYDEVPFPARDLLQEDSFINDDLVSGKKRSTVMITSTGCAFDCAFCSAKIIWKRKVYFHSPEYVRDEVRLLTEKYGIRGLKFADDTLTINKKRILEICRLIEPFNLTWRCYSRIDCIDEEILRAMKKAGCEEIGYGLESADPVVLKAANKKTTIEQAKKICKLTHDCGIELRLFFMIGLPLEKRGIAKTQIEFIDEVNPEAVNISTLIPFPGCDIYNDPKKFGLRIVNEDAFRNYDNYVLTRGLSEDEVAILPVTLPFEMTEKEFLEERMELLQYVKNRNLVRNL